MKENLRRFGWGALAALFVLTGLGVGVYAFWVNIHSSSNTNNYINCPTKSVTATQEKKNGKLEGAKLAGFTPVKKVSYIQCFDLKVGTGATATANSTITANYTGALATNGTIFQSSLDTGAPFTQALSGLIVGWQNGIPGMKVGGTRRLLIPSQYAYGPAAQQGIPANSDLVFDITLLAVK